MKNQIYAGKCANGKFAAEMYTYHKKPSGSIIPLLQVSTEPIFNSEKEAAEAIFNALKPEIRENTEISITEANSGNEKENGKPIG